MTKPFNRIPKGVERLDLSGTVLRVYIALISYANYESGRARVKHSTLAEQVGCSTRAVDGAMSRLRELGLVEAKRTGRSTMFRIVWEWTDSSDQIRTDERIRSEETFGSTEREDSNENPSNDISLPYVSTEPDVRAENESQSETPESVLEAAFPEGEWIDERENEAPAMDAATNEQADTSSVAEKPRRTGLSGLSPEEAAKKFTTDHYNPEMAAREQESLKKALAAATQSVTEAKAMALGRAKTAQPRPFPLRFDPELVGYTRGMFKSEFPLLDYDKTLASFMAYSSTRTDTTINWLGKFLTYAQTGQRQAQERLAANGGDSEPPVNKPVSWDAERKRMYREMARPGEGYAAWQSRMREEGIELP